MSRRIATVRRLIIARAAAPGFAEGLEWLYRQLLEPLGVADHVRELVVVPDGPLRELPFAALRPDRRTYLAERLAVVVAPSIRDLIASRGIRRGSGPAGNGGSILIVGNPAFDQKRWPQLPSLPFASIEAAAVARFYPGATLLDRQHATRTAVLRSLPTADVFHFAGHAIANTEFPDTSRLVLADTSDGGAIPAGDIAPLTLRRGSVVVLSACETAVGHAHRAGAVESIASAFHHAGAGTVVAAAWRVDDRDTARLMSSFHQGLSTGVSPAEALRAAQAAMSTDTDHPAAWAAFSAFTQVVR